MDKQTKAIDEAASQIVENAYKINETLKGTINETQDIAPVFDDTKTANILHEMGGQTNPQLKLNLVDLPTRRYKMKDVGITQMDLLTFSLYQMCYEVISKKMKTKLKSFY